MRLCNLRALILIADKEYCVSQVRRIVKQAKKEYKELNKCFMQDVKEYFCIDENTSPEGLKVTADILVKMIRDKQAEGTAQ